MWQTNQKFSCRTITEAENAVGTPLQSPPYAQHPVEPTPARGRGRKRVRKDRAKAYRDMAKLKVTLVSMATDGEIQKGLSQIGGCGRSIMILDILDANAKSGSWLQHRRIATPVSVSDTATSNS